MSLFAVDPGELAPNGTMINTSSSHMKRARDRETQRLEKAIHALSRILIDKHAGRVPDGFEELEAPFGGCRPTSSLILTPICQVLSPWMGVFLPILRFCVALADSFRSLFASSACA